MAMYEPLRDTFRELNRLIVDKQQFGAQQKLNQSNQQLKNKMLEVTIADNEFRKGIAMAGLNIRRSGQKILKRFQDQQILGLEQQLLKGEYDAVKAQARLKPKEYSFNAILGNDPRLLSNPDLKREIESLYIDRDPNAQWDPATGGMVVNGKRDKLNDIQMGERYAPAVMMMKESYTDAPADAEAEMEDIKLDLKGIRDRKAGILSEESAKYAGTQGLTNLSSLNDSHFTGKKAELKREENALRAQYIKLEQFTSPRGRMDYWNDKRDYFHRMAAHFESLGESGAADNIRVRAGQAATTANTWLTAGTKGTGTGTLQMKNIWKNGKFMGVKAWHTKKGFEIPLGPGETTVAPPQRKPDDAQEAGIKYIESELNPNKYILPLLGDRATVMETVNRKTDKHIRKLQVAGVKLSKADGRTIAMAKLNDYKSNWDAAYAAIYRAENGLGKYADKTKKEREAAIERLQEKAFEEFGMLVEKPYNTMTKYTEGTTPK